MNQVEHDALDCYPEGRPSNKRDRRCGHIYEMVEENLMAAYGPHMMGDLAGCKIERVTDGAFIYKFMKQLVDVIGLNPIGSPHLDLYDGPHEEWEGFSATIHIQTSHITAHFFKFGYVFIDIFSCKPFNEGLTREWVGSQLLPHNTRWQTLKRGENFPIHLIDPEQLAEEAKFDRR